MLEESEEEQASTAGVAAVESKSDFVEIGVQMLRCNRPLVGTEQPAFEQRSNTMLPWHGNVCRISGAGNVCRAVPVSLLGKAVVTFPPVCVNF